ncbi:TRAP transporter large permease [Gilvimarinus agarilyticus]|uniref:TRAP transporter large permease n=1 Tax=Gilvimarinus sp. 2_MG-2023 TaxID=3062666 RepID=UPI001C08681A|nr:TRAP transporter large permease [Gilvimarinus sp. 2_MG-2023]MBU2887721.1 TRAP transporter large permease [Gilvimarinus agarilyticus]MDO6572368.1 TRAP transporter large permease [Gilvimarinus sp. 2_MG-2023]
MTIAVLFIALVILLILGVPIAFALAISALLAIVVDGQVPELVVLHQMVGGMDSFPLLSIPFFIFAGAIMNSAGITHRIFEFAHAMVGWTRGGLGHVNVSASIIFAGMSGAAVADAGGLGAIEIKAMRERGYDADFAVGLTAASSTIGPIIPPSLPIIIYGVMASTSIGQLFAAGFIPGLLMAIALMVMVAWYAKKRNYPKDAKFSISRLGTATKGAFLSLLTPIIIIAGILFGIFTATEAAIAATIYALFLGAVVYRTLSWRSLARISMETIETTSIILLIVAAAASFSWVLTSQRITEDFTIWMLAATDNKIYILLLMTLIFFVVGCFMETIAAITILTPVLLPVAIGLGVDPVHFGVIMVLNLMIGLLTPPVGMVLYVLSRVSDVPFEQCAKATLPFLVPLVIVLILVTFLPQLSMWLPTLLYR